MASDGRNFPPQRQETQPGKEHVMDPTPQAARHQYKPANKLQVSHLYLYLYLYLCLLFMFLLFILSVFVSILIYIYINPFKKNGNFFDSCPFLPIFMINFTHYQQREDATHYIA